MPVLTWRRCSLTITPTPARLTLYAVRVGSTTFTTRATSVTSHTDRSVTLIDTAVFFNFTHSRESRVIGFEKQLNDLYNATYTFGESVAYSRLNDLQGTVEQLTYLTGNTSSGSIGITDLYKQIDWIKRHKLDKIVNDIAEA